MSDPNKATILLVSGELDKALLAFEIAASYAAMGIHVNMWFVLYGINCIKKPRHRFSIKKWWPQKRKPGFGRRPDTDMFSQKIIRALNHDGADQIPLSQLNYFGAGPALFNRVMRKKGMASLQSLIKSTEELGVTFKICQICIDALALDVEDELIVDAQVFGASSYTLDVKDAHYNGVF